MRQNPSRLEMTSTDDSWETVSASEKRKQIRELIVSPLWNYLSVETKERWLDQFLKLPEG